jgi:hypothetical protein
MIWFSNPPKIFPHPAVPARAAADEHARMREALRRVAARTPHLTGDALLDALAATGWVDRPAAARLLPVFRDFDADRYFAESLRRLSIRGAQAAGEFRERVRQVMEDAVGEAQVVEVGPEEGIRFRSGEREGILLAYPEVGLTLGGNLRKSIVAALEEMPDALVIVARNFQDGTREQLASILAGTEVPGTLVTVNLLLGIRAVALRYQPCRERVIATLGAGRPLRTQDVALLGNRE